MQILCHFNKELKNRWILVFLGVLKPPPPPPPQILRDDYIYGFSFNPQNNALK